MTAERMFKEYKNLKKEQGILLFQLEQFSGIEESDVIDSMMFGHADDNDRVQTSNRSDKTASVAINYKSVMDRASRRYNDRCTHCFSRQVSVASRSGKQQ